MSSVNQELWLRDYLAGHKSIENHEWLAEHCQHVLRETGMPEGEAKALGRRLQADIEGLLAAREVARDGLDQLAGLNERDVVKQQLA